MLWQNATHLHPTLQPKKHLPLSAVQVRISTPSFPNIPFPEGKKNMEKKNQALRGLEKS